MKTSKNMKNIAIAALLMVSGMIMNAQDSIEWVSDTMSNADTVKVEEMPSITATAPAQEEPATQAPQQSSGLGWLVLACGLTALVAIGAGVMAYLSRRELAEFKETMYAELENTDKNMHQLAEESAREVNILRDALRTHLTRVTDGSKATAVGTLSSTRQSATTPSRQVTLQTLYLAKPDAKDCFTRATEHFELGNSLFMLTTADGTRGTFVVIDNADAQRFALMMPTENLTRACTGTGIQVSTGKTAIVTDAPGEATYDNGVWRITRKAVIHYV